MEGGAIKDYQISVSSVHQVLSHGPNNARLNKTRDSSGIGAWCTLSATGANDWIQVNFKNYTSVSGVVTQGRSDSPQWVTRFRMNYSYDGSNWESITPESPLAGETVNITI